MISAMHASNTEDPSPETLARAVARIRQEADLFPDVAVILGSGLGPLADQIEAQAVISYDDIPGMFRSSAPGHAGCLYLGTLAGRKVVAMKGRMHLYDGVSAQVVGFPVRLMRALGASSLVVSNACGALEPSWNAGELMLQADFINATGTNALIGPNDDTRGPRFPVMFDCYDRAYRELAVEVARREGMTLREGVYLAVSGPSYATRAELRAFRSMGADAIGMSTVHE
jgi:purine-nucleoside phosphorylase